MDRHEIITCRNCDFSARTIHSEGKEKRPEVLAARESYEAQTLIDIHNRVRPRCHGPEFEFAVYTPKPGDEAGAFRILPPGEISDLFGRL